MEKRLFLFLTLSMLVMLGFTYLNALLAPPRPAADHQRGADVKQPRDAADKARADKPGPDAQAPERGAGDTDIKQPEEEVAAVPPGDGEARPEAVPEQRQTLGSLDPTSGYSMLVTLVNRGAAIERIELNDPRYRDLENNSGYLGHLALSNGPDAGVRVGVVGAGTPAANATPAGQKFATGLRVDDVILALNDQTVQSPRHFDQLLRDTRPGQQVTLRVRRVIGNAPAETAFTALLMRHPLQLVQPEPQVPSAPASTLPPSYRWTLIQLGQHTAKFGQEELAGIPSLLDKTWEVHQVQLDGQPAVEFRFRFSASDVKSLGLTGPMEFVRRFGLARFHPDEPVESDPAYHLTMDLEVRNQSDKPLTFAYRQYGPTGMPLEGWWYAYKTRDVISRSLGGKHRVFSNSSVVKKARRNEQNPATPMYESSVPVPIQYVGVDSPYFASMLKPLATEQEIRAHYSYPVIQARPVGHIDTQHSASTDVSFLLDSSAYQIGAGQTWRQQFQIYAGPKKREILQAYGLEDCIVYGWFGSVAKPMTWLLHGFYWVVRNYGLAIFLLTVLVRGCMFPLSVHQARSAQKMQELAPEMKRIAEQYKNDMEKRAAAQRELFRKHNYNPLTGCLPMFLQLPIFIGLYRALSVDIELRQAPLIPGISWCSNLAAPDQLLFWKPIMPEFIGGYTGFLGPYFNILPVISVVLMLIHQKLFTPPAADEQQALQMKMMKYMMVFIGFLFFKVPAGLCLYFITSSLWGLAERKWVPRPKTGGDSKPVAARLPRPKTGGNGAWGRWGRKKPSYRRR